MFNKGKQKEKYKVHVGMSDFYKYYCLTTFKEKVGKKVIVHWESMYCIDRAVYGQIISKFHQRVIDEIILDNFEYKMPARMGTLSIKKKKPKVFYNDEGVMVNKMPVDWKATRELWEEDPESREQKKLVRHLNEHTNGYVPFWHYDKYSSNYKNKTAYKFIATRTNKRTLTKVLKDPDIDVNFYLK